MTKDLIITKWFDENNVNVENLSLEGVNEMIDAISNFYAENSSIVDKDFIKHYFGSMGVMDVCIIFEDYVKNCSKEEDVIEDDKVTNDKKKSSHKSKIAHHSEHNVLGYDELIHNRAHRVVVGHYRRDASSVDVSELFEGCEEIPTNPEGYVVVHNPLDKEHAALWFDASNLSRTNEVDKRLRHSYRYHYDKDNENPEIFDMKSLSICRGTLYVKRYIRA